MILCKHGLTEIIMIYCIANQPKKRYICGEMGEKVPEMGAQSLHLGRKAFVLGKTDFIWGGKPPIWHIYFSYYGYFKEIGH